MIIATKYLGPTETRGSRIRATSIGSGVSKIVGWDHSLSAGEMHCKAAAVLAESFREDYPSIGEGTIEAVGKDGVHYHVFHIEGE